MAVREGGPQTVLIPVRMGTREAQVTEPIFAAARNLPPMSQGLEPPSQWPELAGPELDLLRLSLFFLHALASLLFLCI